MSLVAGTYSDMAVSVAAPGCNDNFQQCPTSDSSNQATSGSGLSSYLVEVLSR